MIRTIREGIRWIGHFHTAGNPGRNDIDDTQELNYTGICKAIAGTDYEYYVGHEFKPKGDPIEALQSAFEMCNQEWKVAKEMLRSGRKPEFKERR